MRQIKASEVKPGMEVKFDMDGWHVEGTVSRVEPVTFGLEFYSTQGVEMTLCEDTMVTVLSEPTPPQPEEPTEFGARVVAGECKALRGHGRAGGFLPWVVEFPSGNTASYNWKEVCELGPVTVIDADPHWTVPAETPEVPDRITKWPEYDEHLKDHKWKDAIGDIWSFWSGNWEYQVNGEGWRPPLFETRPFDGPWTRVTDA